MTRLLLAGASGLVGGAVLRQALSEPRISAVIAPTRRALPVHAKLTNPLVDFDELPGNAAWWSVDAAICALGTTIRDAGSRDEFRRVDHDYPLAVARAARSHGARTFVLTSSSGADSASRIFYLRVKGELEHHLHREGFDSLTLVRPGLLGGQRERRRPLEYAGMKLLGALGPLLPDRYRVVPAEKVANALVQAALLAHPGVHVIESEAIGIR